MMHKEPLKDIQKTDIERSKNVQKTHKEPQEPLRDSDLVIAVIGLLVNKWVHNPDGRIPLLTVTEIKNELVSQGIYDGVDTPKLIRRTLQQIPKRAPNIILKKQDKRIGGRCKYAPAYSISFKSQHHK